MTAEQEQLLKSFMLQSVHLDVSLNELSSHGSLTFVFKNPVATPVEMLFAFPLMDGGAVITGISTEWDGHRITGRVRASEEGKREYSDAVAKGHTASLVEHAENDLFMWRVGGIPVGSTVTVVTQFCGPVVMIKRFGKKPKTEITLTVPAVVPPWYGKADVGDAALAFDTAVQAPASIGGLALALPPFTATVRSLFITNSLHAVTVTSPTHGPPDASSVRTFHDGLEVTFRDLFKVTAGGKAATNLQLRWVADGIVPNIACVGRMLAGAGLLTAVSSGTDSAVSQDAAAVEAMEMAAAALAAGPLAADALALLDKTKTQRRQVEQVCGVLFSKHDGKQPEGIHVTVLVDCSGSMYPNRIDKARKAVRALLTSLEPSSTFAVYLFGNRCEPVALSGGDVVYAASPENVKAIADKVDSDSVKHMGGTELFAGVQTVLRGQVHVPVARRHNVMILTDGEVGQVESGRVKQMLADVCPGKALVGIIGIGNEVTRATLRTIVEGGLGPQAIMFDSESDESIANIVLGSVSALVSSQLCNVNWPGGKLVGSQPHVQCNSSEVCAAWALYSEAQLAPEAATQDDEWELVDADTSSLSATGASSNGAAVRWSSGAFISVAAARAGDSAVQLPTLLVTNEDVIKSMCVAAALARCRHPSCPRQEATKLALRYGFVCAEADSVMVAISDRPVTDPSIALSRFGIAIPSQPARPSNSGSRASPTMPKIMILGGSGVGKTSLMSAAPSPMCSWSAPMSHGISLPDPAMSMSNMSMAYGPRGGEMHCYSGRRSPGVAQRSHPPPVAACASLHPRPAAAFGASTQMGQMQREQGYTATPFRGPPSLVCPPPPPPSMLSRHAMPFGAPPPIAIMQCASPSFAFATTDGAPTNPAGGSSLLDVLGALHGACWSMQHPAVAHFLAKHLPHAAGMCSSDAHVTVAVIVVLRAHFKDSKNGWLTHAKRAAQHARSALGDLEYASHKAALVCAMSK